MPSENKLTRSVKRIGRILGVEFPEDMPKQEQNNDVQLSFYTPSEMRYLPGVYAPDTNQTIDMSQPTNEILGSLASVSQQAGEWSRQAQSYNILAPEIQDASNIVVSSIMSPTDMQTNRVTITIDGTDLGEEIEDKVAAMLTEFFNSDFRLAKRMCDWLHKAIFVDGAAPILVIPQSNIRTLNQAVDEDEEKQGHNINDIVANAKQRLMGKSEYSAEIAPMLYNDKDTSMELLLPSMTHATTSVKEHYAALESQIDSDIDAAMTQLALEPGYEAFKTNDIVTTTQHAKTAIKELFSEARKMVVITNDATKLDRSRSIRNATKNIEKSVADHFIETGNNPIYLLDIDPKLEDSDHPVVIDVPYQAIIPVTIPGSPDKHIGYFIIVDQWGAPLTDRVYGNSTYNGPRKLSEGAMQAAFGQPAVYKFTAGINDEQRFKAASTMFGVTLHHLLNNKLAEYGLGGVTVDEHESVSLCLFRNLIERKKVGIVFVPASMVTYLTFQYHDDGTGKARTEDLSTLLSLRSVLLVAGVMAATENAIDNKVIEVDIDEKNANAAQYLAMVRDAFIEKKMLRFDNEPLSVQRDLLQRSLTLLPKNMKGIREGLSVNTTHRGGESVSPDQNFMEQLSKWIITGLGVPHAAMNQLGEEQYSRSVATTNLMFNNKIKGAQDIVTDHITKFIRTYLKYSSPLQKKIQEILKQSSKSRKDMHISNERNQAPSKEKVEFNEESISKQLITVIQNVKITLPAPQIVVDKAQYEEITAYADAIDKVLSLIFSENQVLDQEAREMFTLFKDTTKADMIRDYIKQIGFQSSFDIPYPKDISIKSAKDLYHYVFNQKLGFDNFKKYIADEARKHLQEGDTSGGYGDTGMSSGTTDEFGNPTGGAETGGMGETGTAGGGEEGGINDAFNNLENTGGEGEQPQGGGQEPGGNEQGGAEPQEPQDTEFDNTPPPPSF